MTTKKEKKKQITKKVRKFEDKCEGCIGLVVCDSKFKVEPLKIVVPKTYSFPTQTLSIAKKAVKKILVKELKIAKKVKTEIPTQPLKIAKKVEQ